MSSAAADTANKGNKVIYGNDLMLKLRHMSPQPPSLASIPEGARAIFVLPNVINTTVHTVAVQKKPKSASLAAMTAAAAAAGASGSGGTMCPATAGAIASAGFTVRAQSLTTEQPHQQQSAPLNPLSASFESSSSYAAALKSMTDSERAKLQEVRNAFMLRAAESKLLAAAVAANANAVSSTPSKAPAAAVATDASPSPNASAARVGWNTAALGKPAAAIDIAAELARTKKEKSDAAKSTTTASRGRRDDGGSKKVEASSPKKWATDGAVKPSDAVALSEILPSAPMTRSERRRAASSASPSPAAANNNKQSSAKAGGRGGSRKTRSSTASAAKTQPRADSTTSASRARSESRQNTGVASRGVIERYPAFMVNPNVVINGNAPTTAPESFFVGPDGKQYPMPPNPFADLAARMAAGGGGASLLQTEGGVGAPPLMGFSEWYAWWAQQASFFPQFYPVPVEVPVDSEGNVLPFSALAELREIERKREEEEQKKSQRSKSKQANATGKSKESAKRDGAKKKSNADKNSAVVDADQEDDPRVPTTTTAGTTLGKGRVAPAVLTGESLEARHRQRERQIVLGKRTMGYAIYERMRAAGAATAPTRRLATASTATAATLINSNSSSEAISALLNNKPTSTTSVVAAAETLPSGGHVDGSAVNKKVSLGTTNNAAAAVIDIPSDCHAPPFTQACSKRSWDGQVRRWRNALHKLDKYAEMFLTPEEIAAFSLSRHVEDDKTNDDGEDVDVDEEESRPQMVADAVVASLDYDE